VKEERVVQVRTADDADAIVVGAGPAGSAAAHYLAAAGLDVLVLEKSTFPRDKVCGDGLTPRAVAELVRMGVPMRAEDGWIRNRGLRVIGGGHTIHLPWPQIERYPDYGLARARADLDEVLARHAQRTGARLLEGVSVTGPVLDERTDRAVGVRARAVDERGKRLDAPEMTFRAPVVIGAEGVSARLATSRSEERRVGKAREERGRGTLK